MPIYVDNSATTKVRAEVREAMLPYLNEKWGNPSSLHEPGHLAHDALATARENVAALLNCSNEEIYFTGNGTLSNNIALLGRARFAQANGQGKHLITTAIEHSAVLGPAQFLEASGWQVTYLRVNKQGLLSVDDLKREIKPETSIISIAWANNEIGILQPIYELAELAAQAGIFFHTDAVQVTGKLWRPRTRIIPWYRVST
jgi:cysteine desulfurase